MKGKRPSVLILYNIPIGPKTHASRRFVESDAGVLDEVREASDAFKRLKMACRITGVANYDDIPAVLAASPEKVVVNLVEGFHRNPEDMNYVPALCKAFGKSVTGNDTPCLMAAYNKWQTKCVLHRHGIPTPPGVLVPVGEKIRRSRIPRGPYIVKPILSDASEGIDDYSVVKARGPELDRLIARIHRDFKHPALVEQMVGQREINASMFERNGCAEALPLAEIDFSAFGEDRPKIVGYSAKWITDSFEYRHTPIIIPAQLPQDVAEKVRKAALAAWHAIGCRDYARVDFRVSERGDVFVLEVNPNPDITSECGFPNALRAAGISYDEFIETLVMNAQRRLEKPKRRRRLAPRKVDVSAIKIRHTTSADRQHIEDLLVDTGFFRPNEIDVAMEVLDDAIAAGPDGDYQSFAVEIEERPAGWVCFGPTPCTIGTYDIYWIAVSRRYQEKGLGTALITFAEDVIRKRDGRVAVIETSGRDVYQPTRLFYLRRGYNESARLKDFYTPGDDKVVYTKNM